jgi:hypothetical protein
VTDRGSADLIMEASELLRHLDSLAKRPEMFVHPVSFFTIRSYLHGLEAGLKFFGIQYTWEHYESAANAHGFDPRGSIGILQDFREEGLSDQQMVDALIAIEADSYRKALSESSK